MTESVCPSSSRALTTVMIYHDRQSSAQAGRSEQEKAQLRLGCIQSSIHPSIHPQHPFLGAIGWLSRSTSSPQREQWRDKTLGSMDSCFGSVLLSVSLSVCVCVLFCERSTLSRRNQASKQSSMEPSVSTSSSSSSAAIESAPETARLLQLNAELNELVAEEPGIFDDDDDNDDDGEEQQTREGQVNKQSMEKYIKERQVSACVRACVRACVLGE